MVGKMQLDAKSKRFRDLVDKMPICKPVHVVMVDEFGLKSFAGIDYSCAGGDQSVVINVNPDGTLTETTIKELAILEIKEQPFF